MGKKTDGKSKVPEGLTGQREGLLDALIEAMKTKGLHWTQGWGGSMSPYNFSSGRRYNGINRLYLAYLSAAKGYNDPRWVTRKQAIELARARGEFWDVRNLEHAWVEWPVIKERDVLDDDGRPVIDPFTGEVKKRSELVGMKYFQVVNLAQIPGAPAYVTPKGQTHDFSVGQTIIENYYPKTGCKYVEAVTVGTPCYSPADDTVKMPARELFVSAEEFASTLAHETVHSSGASSRLDRDLEHIFGSSDYAYEELVAELGSVMLCADLGIAYAPGEAEVANHAAYLKSWMRALEGDGGMEKLKKAAKQADDASKWIGGFLPAEAFAARPTAVLVQEEDIEVGARDAETIAAAVVPERVGLTSEELDLERAGSFADGTVGEIWREDATEKTATMASALAGSGTDVCDELVAGNLGGCEEKIRAIEIDKLSEGDIAAAARLADEYEEIGTIDAAAEAVRTNTRIADELENVLGGFLPEQAEKIEAALVQVRTSLEPVQPGTALQIASEKLSDAGRAPVFPVAGTRENFPKKNAGLQQSGRRLA